MKFVGISERKSSDNNNSNSNLIKKERTKFASQKGSHLRSSPRTSPSQNNSTYLARSGSLLARSRLLGECKLAASLGAISVLIALAFMAGQRQHQLSAVPLNGRKQIANNSRGIFAVRAALSLLLFLLFLLQNPWHGGQFLIFESLEPQTRPKLRRGQGLAKLGGETKSKHRALCLSLHRQSDASQPQLEQQTKTNSQKMSRRRRPDTGHDPAHTTQVHM